MTFIIILGAVIAGSSVVGILGTWKYNNLMFIYFLATCFLFCGTIFGCVFAAQNGDTVINEMRTKMTNNWEKTYETLPQKAKDKFAGKFTYCAPDDPAYEGFTDECFDEIKDSLAGEYFKPVAISAGVVIFLQFFCVLCAFKILTFQVILTKFLNIFNVIIFVLALVMIAAGVWLKLEVKGEYGNAASIMTLVMGILMAIVGGWGVHVMAVKVNPTPEEVESKKKNTKLYISFMAVLAIIICATAIVGFTSQDAVMDKIDEKADGEEFAKFANAAAASGKKMTKKVCDKVVTKCACDDSKTCVFTDNGPICIIGTKGSMDLSGTQTGTDAAVCSGWGPAVKDPKPATAKCGCATGTFADKCVPKCCKTDMAESDLKSTLYEGCSKGAASLQDTKDRIGKALSMGAAVAIFVAGFVTVYIAAAWYNIKATEGKVEDKLADKKVAKARP